MTIISNPSDTVTVAELDTDQAAKLFEAACQRELSVSAGVFLAAHEAAQYPEEWPVDAISRVEFLLPFVR